MRWIETSISGVVEPHSVMTVPGWGATFHAMCGTRLQRDSDMLRANAGELIGRAKITRLLQRGDLVFWKGHVAMMENETVMIHASVTR